MTTFPPHQAPDFPQADAAANPTVRQGDQGAAVVELQRLLNARGATLVVDGIFGAATDAAVRRFQQDNRLVVDGVVGLRTWVALRSTLASSIRLVDVVAFYDPANYPHQRSALIWLQNQIPLPILMEFAQRWRNSQPVNNPTLQQGDRGVAVVGLQTLLNWFNAGLVVDGIFGAATRAAVIAFQTNNELRPDGIVDAQTWTLLRFVPLRLVDLKTRYNPQQNPHQIQALNWLQTRIPIVTLNEFARQWRNLA